MVRATDKNHRIYQVDFSHLSSICNHPVSRCELWPMFTQLPPQMQVCCFTSSVIVHSQQGQRPVNSGQGTNYLMQLPCTDTRNHFLIAINVDWMWGFSLGFFCCFFTAKIDFTVDLLVETREQIVEKLSDLHLIPQQQIK